MCPGSNYHTLINLLHSFSSTVSVKKNFHNCYVQNFTLIVSFLFRLVQYFQRNMFQYDKQVLKKTDEKASDSD